MIRLLIADDHHLIIDGIQSLLKEEERVKVVATAANGEQVLSALGQQEVDIAIIDIQMPLLDGIATAKAIRQQYPKVKILILTMYDTSEFILQLLAAGANGYLLKNCNRDTLVGAIHAINNGHRYFPPDVLARAEARPAPKPEEEVQLTRREKEVLRLVGLGYTAKKISDELHIGQNTAVSHIQNLRLKLKANNVQELVRYAIKHGYAEV